LAHLCLGHFSRFLLHLTGQQLKSYYGMSAQSSYDPLFFFSFPDVYDPYCSAARFADVPTFPCAKVSPLLDAMVALLAQEGVVLVAQNHDRTASCSPSTLASGARQLPFPAFLICQS
jgi:hypothetical protein